jgi:hypothetical protein
MQGTDVDRLINSLWLMSSELVIYIEKKIKPLGLTIHDLRAVVILGERGSMSPSDLAAALGVTNGAATGIVDRLMAAKVAKRDTPATDKRRRLVTLQYSELDTVLVDVVVTARQLLSGYSPGQIKMIEQYHRDITFVLEQAKEVPQP